MITWRYEDDTNRWLRDPKNSPDQSITPDPIVVLEITMATKFRREKVKWTVHFYSKQIIKQRDKATKLKKPNKVIDDMERNNNISRGVQ